MLRYKRKSKQTVQGCERFYYNETFLKNRLLFRENKPSLPQLFEPKYSIVLFSLSLTTYETSKVVKTLGIVFFLCEGRGVGGQKKNVLPPQSTQEMRRHAVSHAPLTTFWELCQIGNLQQGNFIKDSLKQVRVLKVHKIEIFFGFDVEIFIISLLVMSKY